MTFTLLYQVPLLQIYESRITSRSTSRIKQEMSEQLSSGSLSDYNTRQPFTT